MGEILSQGFSLTWRHPWFWIIGFAMYPGLLGNLPFQPSEQTLEAGLAAVGVLITYVLATGFIALMAYTILQPGLILATVAARSESPRRAMEALGAGFDFFGRFFGIAMLALAGYIGASIMLMLPIIIAFVVSEILGFVILFLFMPLFLALILIVGAIFSLAFRNAVLLNLSVGESMSTAFRQFREKKWPAMGLILVTTIISIVIVFPLAIVVVLIQTALQLAAGESLVISLLTYLGTALLSVFVVGFLNAFSNVSFTVAYQEWFMIPAQTPPPAMDSQTQASLEDYNI